MKLLILHLSDLHIRDRENHALDKLKILTQAVQNVEPQLDAIAVIVSGDLAWSAKKEEYDIARTGLVELQEQLRAKTKICDVPFIIVPGNHDCQFDRATGARDLVIQGILKGASTKIDVSIMNVCCEIQDNFFAFLSSFPTKALERKEGRIYYEYAYTKNEQRVLFRCYNTAWLSQLKEQQGGLLYPSQYLGEFDPVSVSPVFDSALFKVFDGLTKRVAAAAGLVPSSVPLLAWETGTGTAARVQFYLLRFEDDKT